MATKKNGLPIGVFDSGIGGLTVLRALQQKLPYESFLYLGDTARLPYGTKSPETIVRYVKQANEVLIDKGIKLLVIACNTASALALEALKKSFPQIPIIGVLEPGAKAASAASQTGRIIVIATEATVNAGGYQILIRKFRPDAQVVAQSCSLFVALAEEGWVDSEITTAVAKRYLQPLFSSFAADCLVLGCTHFPILLPAIKKIIDQNVVIVDSASTTAETVAALLNELGLENHNSKKTSTHFYVTDAPERFAKIAKNFLGVELKPEDVELIDVSS